VKSTTSHSPEKYNKESMIKQKVTLVLGAGASAPYGFPLGRKLMVDVINKLNTSNSGHDQGFSQVLLRLGFDGQLQSDFAAEMRWAKQSSIDAFVQERQEFLQIGKAAIAAALIPYENLDDLVSLESEFSSEPTNQRWYTYLLDLLGESQTFTENHLSIITFNYDRSLEYFIFQTLIHRFNLAAALAIELLKTIPIIHVYGQLGKFDFESEANGRPYSTLMDDINVKQCVDEMNLIHEPRDEDEFAKSKEDVYKVLRNTETLIFLGFGYHEKNLERLRLSQNFIGNTVVPTFYGMKEGEKQRSDQLIHKYIGQHFASHPQAYPTLDFLQYTNFLI
jgi:hypothetical protein